MLGQMGFIRSEKNTYLTAGDNLLTCCRVMETFLSCHLTPNRYYYYYYYITRYYYGHHVTLYQCLYPPFDCFFLPAKNCNFTVSIVIIRSNNIYYLAICDGDVCDDDVCDGDVCDVNDC